MTKMDAGLSVAQEAARPPGSEPTTCTHVRAVYKFNQAERMATRRLYRHCVEHHHAVLECFYATTAELARRCQAVGYDWHELAVYETAVAHTVDMDMEEAVRMMCRKLDWMIKTYWPECDLPVYKEFLSQSAAYLRT